MTTKAERLSSKDNEDDYDIEFEIQEAKKQCADFPYWKKEQFKSIRRAIFE